MLKTIRRTAHTYGPGVCFHIIGCNYYHCCVNGRANHQLMKDTGTALKWEAVIRHSLDMYNTKTQRLAMSVRPQISNGRQLY